MKRTITHILVTTLIISLLTACNGNSQNNERNNSDIAGVASASNEENSSNTSDEPVTSEDNADNSSQITASDDTQIGGTDESKNNTQVKHLIRTPITTLIIQAQTQAATLRQTPMKITAVHPLFRKKNRQGFWFRENAVIILLGK